MIKNGLVVNNKQSIFYKNNSNSHSAVCSKMESCLDVLGIDVRFAWVGAVGAIRISRSRRKSLCSSCLDSALCGLCCTQHDSTERLKNATATGQEMDVMDAMDDVDDDGESDSLNGGDVEGADIGFEPNKFNINIKQRSKYSKLNDNDQKDIETYGDPNACPKDIGSTSYAIFVFGPHWYCVFVAVFTIVGGALLTNSILSNMDYSPEATLALRVFVDVCCTSAIVFLFLTATVSTISILCL